MSLQKSFKIETTVKRIKKRNGKIVKFVPSKIIRAIQGAFKSAGEEGDHQAEKLAREVISEVEKRFNQKVIPEVEQVQDLIESVLKKK